MPCALADFAHHTKDILRAFPPTMRSLAVCAARDDWPLTPVRKNCARGLQSHEVEEELTPKINHPAPGIFHLAVWRRFQNAFFDVVRDLIA